MSGGAARTALLFAGQGSQRKGMGLPLIQNRSSPAARVWAAAQERLKFDFGFDVSTIIRDDPPEATCGGVPYVTRRGPGGVLGHTVFTQPSLVTFQTAAYEAFRAANPKAEFHCVAGHSLGEFSALAAVGAIDPAAAARLVCRRGQIMMDAVKPHTTRQAVGDPTIFPVFAVNPRRAELLPPLASDSASVDANESASPTSSVPDDEAVDAVLFEVMELISQAGADLWGTNGAAMIELINYNVRGEQVIVAGDRVSLAALGKCLDPQWRSTIVAELGLPIGQPLDVRDMVAAAVAESAADAKLGVAKDPNIEKKLHFVAGSRKKTHRWDVGKIMWPTIDGGRTPMPVQLEHLSRQGDGRSGLKKKSWFLPLDLPVPFHSSVLKRGLGDLYKELLEALPADDRVAAALDWRSGSRPMWVTNVTATPFDSSSAEFRAEVVASIGDMNIGEAAHVGRFIPSCIPTLVSAAQHGSARELLAAVCALQLVRTVQWASCMDFMVLNEGCTRAVEVTAAPTLIPMLKKAGLSVGSDRCARRHHTTPPAVAAASPLGIAATGTIPADSEGALNRWTW